MQTHRLTDSELEEKDLIDLIRTATALVSRRELRRTRNKLEADTIKSLREARNSGKPFELGLKELLNP